MPTDLSHRSVEPEPQQREGTEERQGDHQSAPQKGATTHTHTALCTRAEKGSPQATTRRTRQTPSVQPDSRLHIHGACSFEQNYLSPHGVMKKKPETKCVACLTRRRAYVWELGLPQPDCPLAGHIRFYNIAKLLNLPIAEISRNYDPTPSRKPQAVHNVLCCFWCPGQRPVQSPACSSSIIVSCGTCLRFPCRMSGTH